MDSGIFEYLLGELLRVIQNSGKGQLIFTSQNLCPLETLKRRSIVFTTTNANDRYTRFKNVGNTSNLRSMYLREMALGGNDDMTLYADTSMSEIAHAMRTVNKRMEDIVLMEEASEVSGG